MEGALLRIGTRGSRLALWQAECVKRRLEERQGVRCAIEVIATQGDASQTSGTFPTDSPGLFVKEIQRALTDRKVDLAVHSLKDLPSQDPEGLQLGAVLKRDDPRDLVVCADAHWRAALSAALIGGDLQAVSAATIATSSPRRAAMLRDRLGQVRVVGMRGNIDTRIRKLGAGEAHATLLSRCGVDRLGFELPASFALPLDCSLPASGQGTIAIECRTDDRQTLELLADVTHPPTWAAIQAERSFMRHLGAGCQTPVGVFGELCETKSGGPDAGDAGTEVETSGPEITLRAVLFGDQPGQKIAGRFSGAAHRAEAIGRSLAEDFLADGAGALLKRS